MLLHTSSEPVALGAQYKPGAHEVLVQLTPSEASPAHLPSPCSNEQPRPVAQSSFVLQLSPPVPSALHVLVGDSPTYQQRVPGAHCDVLEHTAPEARGGMQDPSALQPSLRGQASGQTAARGTHT
jgi:hypothetical protein